MKDQTLADIDDMVGAGSFLSEFTGPKLECITKLSMCQDIVHWIKKTTEGDGYYIMMKSAQICNSLIFNRCQ